MRRNLELQRQLFRKVHFKMVGRRTQTGNSILAALDGRNNGVAHFRNIIDQVGFPRGRELIGVNDSLRATLATL